MFSSFVQQIDKIFRLRVNVDPSLSLKLINEDGRLLPFPSPLMGTRSKKLLYFCQGMYRVHPTKQGNGNPTKGGLSLSLSIPPWHNAICSTYFRPVAFFRFYPRLFSTPRPHIIHSFQPLAPFLSPFSPSSLDSRGNNRGASFVAHSNLRQKTPAKPLAETYVFGRWLSLRFIESVTLLGSLMIIRDGKKGPVFFPGNIFKRYFRDILSKSCYNYSQIYVVQTMFKRMNVQKLCPLVRFYDLRIFDKISIKSPEPWEVKSKREINFYSIL